MDTREKVALVSMLGLVGGIGIAVFLSVRNPNYGIPKGPLASLPLTQDQMVAKAKSLIMNTKEYHEDTAMVREIAKQQNLNFDDAQLETERLGFKSFRLILDDSMTNYDLGEIAFGGVNQNPIVETEDPLDLCGAFRFMANTRSNTCYWGELYSQGNIEWNPMTNMNPHVHQYGSSFGPRSQGKPILQGARIQ